MSSVPWVSALTSVNIHAHEVFPSEMLGAPPALGTKSLAKMQEDTGSGRGGIESACNRDNMFLDLCPGPRGHVGQVIVAITECDFEVVGDSFGDFLRRLATALEDGLLEVRETASAPRVVAKGTEYGRWESVLRCVEPR